MFSTFSKLLFCYFYRCFFIRTDVFVVLQIFLYFYKCFCISPVFIFFTDVVLGYVLFLTIFTIFFTKLLFFSLFLQMFFNFYKCFSFFYKCFYVFTDVFIFNGGF